MIYNNLLLIGTSHISAESIKEIEDAFMRHAPAIVAVELDRKRLHALMTDEKTRPGLAAMLKVGLKGFMFAVIGGWIQRKLGNAVGVSPGSEMKRAVQLAGETKAKVALIDRDIDQTLHKFSQNLTWKEKFRFIAELIKSVLFKKKMLKELGIEDGNLDLSKVPSKQLIKTLLNHLEKRYPNVYDVLVRQRNVIMANNLVKLMHKFPDEPILAVVGAGHEEEMMIMIKKRMSCEVDVV
ncbi:TraB/GumN family protein [Candidatus Woesearchaeota archaeon]|nr:TraB/GumN family protein [Candidatus Woesearchaeota archaeon]